MNRHLCLLAILCGLLLAAAPAPAQTVSPSQGVSQITPTAAPAPANVGWQIFFGIVGGGIIASIFSVGATLWAKNLEIAHLKQNLAVQLAVAEYKAKTDVAREAHMADLARNGLQLADHPFQPAGIADAVKEILLTMEQLDEGTAKHAPDQILKRQWSTLTSATKTSYDNASRNAIRLSRRIWLGWDKA